MVSTKSTVFSQKMQGTRSCTTILGAWPRVITLETWSDILGSPVVWLAKRLFVCRQYLKLTIVPLASTHSHKHIARHLMFLTQCRAEQLSAAQARGYRRLRERSGVAVALAFSGTALHCGSGSARSKFELRRLHITSLHHPRFAHTQPSHYAKSIRENRPS
jgi:hypothetical protein